MCKESGEKSAKCLQLKIRIHLGLIVSCYLNYKLLLLYYRPEVTWRRGDGEMITVKTAGKKIKSKFLKYFTKKSSQIFSIFKWFSKFYFLRKVARYSSTVASLNSREVSGSEDNILNMNVRTYCMNVIVNVWNEKDKINKKSGSSFPNPYKQTQFYDVIHVLRNHKNVMY